MFLYEKLDTLRSTGLVNSVPRYIGENLNQSFKLRPYQLEGFENFITYFENDKIRAKPSQTLFHMATGSGKTLMMAGLLIYLYKKGYRNFLFFVNRTNIVEKTRDNFFNNNSIKFLFNDEIIIDGEKVLLKEVSNFQHSDSSAINICFTTIQGLHLDMWNIKENSFTIDDFQNKKTVLISDEAHHLNASTKKKMTKEEESNYNSWEYTVNRIFNANNENILLEFTATCDLKNILIKSAYENKIIFDYPLYKFRSDLYSKEIKTFRSDVTIMERAILAIVLSQYRLKVFEDNKLAIKPIVLFKSQYLNNGKNNNYTSLDFLNDFQETLRNLNGNEIYRISNLTVNETMKEVFNYFSQKHISFEQLAQELREDFCIEHCLYANDTNDIEKNQMALNSLEDKRNPYRAVFAVDKLNEGWDVLNLFDIVRLYETRQGGNKISPATVTEAQLIGRGSRYCPFQIDSTQDKYKRKFDNDLDNPLRICEELYYHCQNDSKYIYELNTALKEIGIDLDKIVSKDYRLKEDFKSNELYKSGHVFVNKRIIKSRSLVTGILPSIRDKVYSITIETGKTGEDTLLDEAPIVVEDKVNLHTTRITFREISEINYAIVQKALCKFPVYKFNTLKSYFPNLKSTKEFIIDNNYLGNIRIEITSKFEKLPVYVLNHACDNVLSKISNKISDIEEVYEGTSEFNAVHIHDIFKDKRVNYTDPHDGGVGVSQNDLSVPNNIRLDLLNEKWFAFEDNYGTSEEKAFISYFKTYIEKLNQKFDEVFLLRNERQVVIYSFDGGERFEPDFILFLHKKNKDGYEQLQIFIEPKGSHLLEKDSWKEKFLLELENEAIPVTKFVDDNNYKIWGFNFFNREYRENEFIIDMNKVLDI